MTQVRRQNLTVRLSMETIRKAKILAARRSMSISRLLSEQVEALVSKDEAYERARVSAQALMERGFHLGGSGTANRDELHRR